MTHSDTPEVPALADTSRNAGTFPSTHWSVVVAAADSISDSSSSRALETLCRAYWQPVYAFCRFKGAKPEDARDLTQAFLADFLTNGPLKRADPARGRFRSYLLGALKFFLADEHDRASALKRGAGIEFVSIDMLLAESRYGLEPASPQTPDAAYDRAWALAVLDRALGRLREEFELSGRASLFDVLKVFLTGDRPEFTFAQAAERLRMTEGAAKMTVTRMRQRFAALVRQELSQTVLTGSELEEELRAFAAALRG